MIPVAAGAPAADEVSAPDAATAGTTPAALGKTLKRGAKVSAFALLVVQLSSLVSTLLVGRLLDPAEVGLYAAGTVLTGFMIMFAEGGLRGALIQRDGDITVAADTVFWVTAASGVVMSLGALGASRIVAEVFDNPAAGQIGAITAGMLLIYALINVPEALLQRNFNFNKRLYVDPGRSLAYGIVAVTLAASGFGVWALVIGNYVSLLVWLIGVWVLARYRPGKGRFDFALWREMARFSFPLLLDRLAEQARDTGQTVLIGRGLGEGSLGNYRYGKRLAMLPGVAVIEVGSYVLFPAFSRLAADPARLKDAFLKVMRWIWFGAAPVAGLAVALGEPVVVLLLGEPWRGAGLMFAAMAGFGVGVALQSAASEAIKGSGRTRLLNWTTLTGLVLGLGLLVALLPLGLVGVGLAISITEIAVGVVMIGLARRIVGFTLGELLRRLAPPLVAALVALAVVDPLQALVLRADERPILLGLLLVMVAVLAFGAVYLAVLRVLDPPMVAEILAAVRSRLRRRAAADDGTGPDDGTGTPRPVPPDPGPPPAARPQDVPVWATPRTTAGDRTAGRWAVGRPEDATEIIPMVFDRGPRPPGGGRFGPGPRRPGPVPREDAPSGVRPSPGARMLGTDRARTGTEVRDSDARRDEEVYE